MEVEIVFQFNSDSNDNNSHKVELKDSSKKTKNTPKGESSVYFGGSKTKGYIYISIRGGLQKYRVGSLWKTEFKLIKKAEVYFNEEEERVS